MKFIQIFLPLALLGVCIVAPASVSAHETRAYLINGNTYTITVGSIGEPVVVDDESGTDLTISRNGSPLEGAEEGLKAEVSIGEAKRVFDLDPVYNAPGKYKNTFYPTVADTLSYRIHGILDGNEVDFTYTCSAAGHQMHAVEDTTRVDVGNGIVRTLQRGAFGCPVAKADYEFPVVTEDQAGLAAAVALWQWIAGIALVLALLSILLNAGIVRGKKLDMAIPRIPAGKNTLVYVVAAVILGGLIGYAVSTIDFESASEPPEVSHGAHAMKEVDSTMSAPTLSLEAVPDSMDGYNVHLVTTNFRFTPETAGKSAVNGRGHGHIYVNGVKIGRVYSEWYHVSADKLASGNNVIEVTLNADDHSEWTVMGAHISAKTTVSK